MGAEGIKSHTVPSNSKEKAVAWDLGSLQLNVCANSCLASPSYLKQFLADFVFSCLWTSLTRFLFTKNLVHMKQALGKSLLKVYQLNRFPVCLCCCAVEVFLVYFSSIERQRPRHRVRRANLVQSKKTNYSFPVLKYLLSSETTCFWNCGEVVPINIPSRSI